MVDRHGPYRQVRFILEFDDLVKAGFSRCHIPDTRTNVVKYREGNDPPWHRKLWGLNEFGPLILENGVTDDSVSLFEWREKVERGSLDDARSDIAVIILDEEGNPGPRWEFRNAWPARYEGPKLDANRDGVAIERLVITHERMTRVSNSSYSGSTHLQATADSEEEEVEADVTDRTGVKTPTKAAQVRESGTESLEQVNKTPPDKRDSEEATKKKSKRASRRANESVGKETERSE